MPKNVQQYEGTAPLMSSRHIQRYGWIPDLPDQRDRYFRAAKPLPIPVRTDLSSSPGFPPIFDQGDLGSCTGNGLSRAVAYDRAKCGDTPLFVPSRLFIYYQERVEEHTVNQDAGAMIRDGIKALARWGVCSETTWPYDIAQFTTKPSDAAYAEASKYKIQSYARLRQTAMAMQQCLASGFPFVFGFTVYESFESPAVAQTGVVPMPQKTEVVLGGHCVVAVGYDQTKSQFKCANSWGPDWGDKGYFYMPFAYMVSGDLASDFWQITVAK